MTAMTKANVPAPKTPDAIILPRQKGIQQEFGREKRFSTRRSSLSVSPLLIQPKLAIGKPDDEYEREADRVAETVMRMPEPEIQRKPT